MEGIKYVNIADYDDGKMCGYANIKNLGNKTVEIDIQLTGDDKQGHVVFKLNYEQVGFLFETFEDALEMINNNHNKKLQRVYDAALRQWRKY